MDEGYTRLKELFLHVADLMDGDWGGEGIPKDQFVALELAYEKALAVHPCLTWYSNAVKERNSEL